MAITPYKLLAFFGAFETFTGLLLIVAGVLSHIFISWQRRWFTRYGFWAGILALAVGVMAIMSARPRVSDQIQCIAFDSVITEGRNAHVPRCSGDRVLWCGRLRRLYMADRTASRCHGIAMAEGEC